MTKIKVIAGLLLMIAVMSSCVPTDVVVDDTIYVPRTHVILHTGYPVYSRYYHTVRPVHRPRVYYHKIPHGSRPVPSPNGGFRKR